MANQLKVQLEGILHEIMPAQTVIGANGTSFTKQEIVVLCQKPNNKEEYFKFEVSGEMYLNYLVSSFNKGDKIIVRAWVNGRKYEKDGKEAYFISLSLDHINKVV